MPGMRTRTLAAMATAGAAAFGGATTLALAADDPPKRAKPQVRAVAPFDRTAPLFVHGGLLDRFGLDRTLGQELAQELGMEQEKVDAALRKVVETRLNEHRDKVLACFDDPARCAGVRRPELALPEVVPGPPMIPPAITKPRRP